VERKELEKLADVMWDEGCSMKIMIFLEHDKQQREDLARMEAERDYCRRVAEHNKTLGERFSAERDTAQAQLAEAVGFFRALNRSRSYSGMLSIMLDVQEFIARHAKAEQQEG